MKILYLKHILFILVTQNVASDGIQVQVEKGLLEGELLDLVTKEGQYYSFKGIPYAAPPIGTLRFKAPQPAVAWDGIRNATQHGSVCPHVEILTNVFIPGNEDCLFINVYSPNLTPDTLLPVLVFIHGGAYKSGSGNVDSFGPDFLIRKNMTVVTFNYRLDALGFLSLGTVDVPGNAGLKDQVMALKWVQTNIKNFGGDPTKVTIMGQSAGSASVAFHVSSPMSQGLFHRAIALSGSPFCDWSLAVHPERRAFVLGKKLGFKTEDPDELLGFLQTVSSDKLVDTSPNVFSSEVYTRNVIKMLHFVPVVEKYCGEDNFLTYNLFENFTHINKADILFGHTNQEVVTAIDTIVSSLIPHYDEYPELFTPLKISNKFSPSPDINFSDKIRKYYFGNNSVDINSTKEFVNYANNVGFVYDIIRYFSTLPIIENTVRYYYQFSSMSSRNVYGLLGEKYGIFGAGHIDDLMYLFNPNSLNLTSDLNSLEFSLIDQVTTLFTNFAIYGNPTPDSSLNVTWPLFDNSTLQYVNIGNNLTVGSIKDDDNFNFWNQFYSSIGTNYSECSAY